MVFRILEHAAAVLGVIFVCLACAVVKLLYDDHRTMDKHTKEIARIRREFGDSC